MDKKSNFLFTFTLLFFLSVSMYSQQFKIDSVKINNITCYGYNNGVIAVFVSGGNPPFSYALNKGLIALEHISKSNLIAEQQYYFKNIEPGQNYWVAVKDNNEDVTKKTNIKISEPEKMSAKIQHEPNPLNHNSFDVSIIASGGTPPYRLIDESDEMIDNPFENNIKIKDIKKNNYKWYIIDNNNCRLNIKVDLN